MEEFYLLHMKLKFVSEVFENNNIKYQKTNIKGTKM